MKYASVFTINIYSVSERPSPPAESIQASRRLANTDEDLSPQYIKRADIFVHKYGNSGRRTNVNNTETFAQPEPAVRQLLRSELPDFVAAEKAISST